MGACSAARLQRGAVCQTSGFFVNFGIAAPIACTPELVCGCCCCSRRFFLTVPDAAVFIVGLWLTQLSSVNPAGLPRASLGGSAVVAPAPRSPLDGVSALAIRRDGLRRFRARPRARSHLAPAHLISVGGGPGLSGPGWGRGAPGKRRKLWFAAALDAAPGARPAPGTARLIRAEIEDAVRLVSERRGGGRARHARRRGRGRRGAPGPSGTASRGRCARRAPPRRRSRSQLQRLRRSAFGAAYALAANPASACCGTHAEPRRRKRTGPRPEPVWPSGLRPC